ncbi:TlpA disulfide reductase family protein [Asanoa sp. NPDC050611]|uniref:TlpA family protein disulfide reductase n=1 Tax=Asanoa sp. NPDC050611 TaxID=3157098 RepID=UPI0033FA208A
MKRYLPLFVLLVAGLLAGVGVRSCSNRSSSDGATGEPVGSAAAPTVSFADCRTLTRPPKESSDAKPAPAATDIALPAAELSCFGGGNLRLADVRGPAVINLWGSWCTPCREELPAVNAVAQRTTGLVHFLGVDTRDKRSDGEAMVSEFGLTYATVFDDGERARIGLKLAGIPATLFVDSAGKVVYLYNGAPLDEAGLTELVQRHLGVAVPVG